jgi:hypothetical protein
VAQFIERAAAGDKAATDRGCFATAVMSMTWRMLGNEAMPDAQGSISQGLQVSRPLRQDQDFFAWLYRVTVNICRDFCAAPATHGSLLPYGKETAL